MPSNNQDPANWFHLWSEMLDDIAALDESFEVLSDDERARARRFRFERDRIRFVARRAFARKVLAEHIGVTPARIRIRTSPLGRPELDPPCGVFFNTSHSDGLAVVAVAFERLVGVDVERIRPVADTLGLADRYFAPAEVDLLRSTPVVSRAEVFLTIWTRKESYAKAIGAGLSMPFEAFDVSRGDDAGVGSPRGPRGDARFVFASLDTPAGYAGAVTLSDTKFVTHALASPAGSS